MPGVGGSPAGPGGRGRAFAGPSPHAATQSESFLRKGAIRRGGGAAHPNMAPKVFTRAGRTPARF